MRVTLVSTTHVVTFNGVPCRIWEGATAGGIPCHAFIARVGCALDAPSAEFDRDLTEHAPPSPEIQEIPLRLVL
jgi:hypothetical protein